MASFISTRVVCVRHEIIHPNILLRARYENAQLPAAEHSQPVQTNHISQTIPESTALGLDLPVQLVVCHKVDVLNPVLRGHWYGITLRLQQLNPSLTKLLHNHSEVNPHIILNVPFVGFQSQQISVQFWVQRVQMINVQGLAKQLREEEWSKGKFDQQILIHCLSKHSANEVIV